MTYLYRAYDSDDRLLYVGIAEDLVARFKDHSRYSIAWIGQMVKLEAESYPLRSDAFAAETQAIHAEGPVHNRAASPNRKQAAQLRRAAEEVRASTPHDFTEEAFQRGHAEYVRVWRIARFASYSARRVPTPHDQDCTNTN